MRRTVTLVTGPSVEPVTLDELKAWAKIDSADEDALLTSLIAAARDAAEQYLRRALITQTVRLTLDLDGRGIDLPEGVYDLPVSAIYGGLPTVVELPRPPVSSVTSVVTYEPPARRGVRDHLHRRLRGLGGERPAVHSHRRPDARPDHVRRPHRVRHAGELPAPAPPLPHPGRAVPWVRRASHSSPRS
ncbi:MAG: phage gp6-like head-tail connector protein [Hyphomicrobium sp.]|nr:phage gp6-like head-tail connector protein [Hyphomicrobium sp.]